MASCLPRKWEGLPDVCLAVRSRCWYRFFVWHWSINIKRGQAYSLPNRGMELSGICVLVNGQQGFALCLAGSHLRLKRLSRGYAITLLTAAADSERFNAAAPISYTQSEASSCLMLHGEEKNPLAPSAKAHAFCAALLTVGVRTGPCRHLRRD